MGLRDKVKKATEAVVSKSEPGKDASAEPQRNPKDRKIEDVLYVLCIPATYEIPEEVFLVEDLRQVDFDMQVPHGFDEGQVMKFVGQTRQSITFLVNLLRERNEHVAKLASVIDKLQVDANNLRWEAEVANGVSIMPTTDDADLETQLTETKLALRRAEDQLRTVEAEKKDRPASGLPLPLPGAGGPSIPVDAYEKVADELSLMKRRNATLEEELFTAKGRLAAFEEDEEGPAPFSNVRLPDNEKVFDDLGISEPEYDEGPEDLTLPAASMGREYSRPSLPPIVGLEDLSDDSDYEVDYTPIFPRGKRALSVFDDNEVNLEAMLGSLPPSEDD